MERQQSTKYYDRYRKYKQNYLRWKKEMDARELEENSDDNKELENMEVKIESTTTNCSICGLDKANCVGHFGQIIAEPVFHGDFVDHIKTMLGTICLTSSKLLVCKTDVIVENINNEKEELDIENLDDIEIVIKI